MSAPVDVLAWIDARVAAHEALSESDAYHAQELPKAQAVRAAVVELMEASERANLLVGLLTVRQVIDAGDAYIEAAGLNPYCINEGLAEGPECIGFWRLDAALDFCGGAA